MGLAANLSRLVAGSRGENRPRYEIYFDEAH